MTENATIRNIDLRRAVLALLLRASGPVTLDEIVAHLDAVDRIDLGAGRHRSGRRRVSDVLSWQIEAGRVERIQRGVYRIVPGVLSRTTRWRCLNWQRARDERQAS